MPGSADSSASRFPRWCLVLALVVAVVQQVALLPFLGEDEPWHMEYVEHVAAGRMPAMVRQPSAEHYGDLSGSELQASFRFPQASHDELRATQERLVDALERVDVWSRVDWAEDPGHAASFDAVQHSISGMHQPPGYALVVGAWLALCPSDDAIVRLRWARLPSILAYLLVVFVSFRAACALGGPAPPAAVAAAAALLPTHARQAATVNPDVLANAVGALALLFALRFRRSRAARDAAGAVGAALAAPFVKATALTAWISAAGAALFAIRTPRARGRTVGLCVCGLAVAALGLAVLLFRSPALPKSLDTALERLERGAGLANLHELARSGFGAFGWYSRALPETGFHVFLAFGAVALVGLLIALRRRDEHLSRRVLGLFVLLVLAQLAAVVWRGAAAARYLYPALPALAALSITGWYAWFPPSRRVLADRLLAFGLALWHGLALLHGALLLERLHLAA